MNCRIPERFVGFRLVFACGVAVFGLTARAQQTAQFQMDFTNPQLAPAHWVLRLNPDGSGYFDAEGGERAEGGDRQIMAGDVHRPVQVSAALAERVFATARAKRLFAYPCDSRLKVAFQGTKRFSYSGPDGSGACEFNYSKDKEIEELQNALMAVETTILSGARMEKLLQHDRLGLDAELENLTTWAHEGNAQEMGAIRETLARIASNDEVMERARRKARLLLTQAQ